MVKAYLRYEHSASFGVITAAGALAYDPQTQLLAAAALEDVALWNVKQGTLVRKLTATASGQATAEVTQLAAYPRGKLLAAGYSDGTVRLWDAATGVCDVSLSGHKAPVSALRFNRSGSQLASGSQDTDVILWDVVAQAGLFRLRGHHGQVTGLAFLEAGNRLVSCAKDGYLKVWELSTQHCSQTVVGHRGEVWALDVDVAQQRVVTGSSDADLRVFTVHDSDGTGASTSYSTLVGAGSVQRVASERAAAVKYDAGGALLGVQSAGRAVELFRVRSAADALKHMKRRRKRKREKAAKGGAVAGGDDVALVDGSDEVITASDELEPLQVVRTKQKIRDFVFSVLPPKGTLAQITLSLANNSIEVWDVTADGVARSTSLDANGHRADIRAVALSSDDAQLLSASSTAVKVWKPSSGACISTIDTGYGLSLLWAPGNRHAVVGTKEGTLEVLDLGAATQSEVVAAHSGAVWSLAALPDQSGFVSGSADHEVKFWEWQLVTEATEAADAPGSAPTPQRRLSIKHTRTLKMTDDALCVRISPDGKLLAVALLDCTIKVFFLDSLRFFLSLYGHKLPVLAMDISSDSTLLVSGGADKNLKVWGLDFGDCHRSLFAHGDSLMAVAFQPNTHYVFTAGKDKLVKYWDADKFEQLLSLGGHHGAVWGLAVSSLGDMVVSCGADRTLRRWERTEEPFFVEEEREAALESMFEADLEETFERRTEAEQGPPSHSEGSAAPATRRTLASLSATDAIADALEAADAEERRQRDHAASGSRGKLPANPLMGGLGGGDYVRTAVAGVKAGDLEVALTCLPFAEALRLLPRLCQWLSSASQVELGCRVGVLLVRLHRAQLVSTPSARPVLMQLQTLLHSQVGTLKDTLGFNLAAMRHLSRTSLTANAVMGDDGDTARQPSKRLREATPA